MSKNVRYECTRCGTCCRWPGYVRVTADEVDTIAAFLGLDVYEFLDRYTTLTPDRQGLTLVEREDGPCVFLTEDNLCRINPVKPTQCRNFPHLWSFPGFEKLCQARVLEH